MNITPSSKGKIIEVKEKQRNVIIGCDKAIADLEANIQTLQVELATQNQIKQQAQNILKDLDIDFPDVVEAEPIGV